MEMESEMITTGNTSPAFIDLGEREQQLEMLLHVQQFSSLIVLLSGSDGTGKSALLAHAKEQLPSEHHVIHFDALHNSDEHSVIACIASQLSCTSSFDAIRETSADEYKFVLVDDAHLLELSALLLLVKLSTSQSTWHLVLCGDGIVADKLNAMQQEQQLENIYHHIVLEALSEVDSTLFVSQLYLQAGHENLPLSEQKIHQLWLLSGGLPGKLIELINVEKEHEQKIKARFPLGHVTAIMLIGVALVFSFMYQDESQIKGAQDVIAQLLKEKSISVSTEEVVKESEIAIKIPQELLNTSAQKLVSIEKSKSVVVSGQSNNPPPKNVPSQQLTVAEIAASVSPKKQISQATNTVPALSATPVKTKPAARAKSHPLLAAQPNEYLLQLLGVRSEKSAQSFMSRFARQLDADKLSVYQTQYKGQPWFVVVYGPFSSKNSANSEASSLGRTLKSRPWIRPVSQIQRDIRQFTSP